MVAEHGCQNVVKAVSDVSCNIVQLRYAVFFFGGGGDDLYSYNLCIKDTYNHLSKPG